MLNAGHESVQTPRFDRHDDITLLENIEEVFGYLVIYRVGRKELRLPRLKLIRAVVQHGIYFYDNPGLCYTPFTLKWDEMVESSDLQTIDLFALHSNANISLWYEYCQCKYMNICMNRFNNDVSTEQPLFNLSNSINEFTVDDISSTITQSSENIQNFHSISQVQSDKSTIQTIDNEMDLSKANQVNNQETLIEHLFVENDDMPQLSSTNQNDMKSMPKIAAELDQLYTDNNSLASDLIYDETTISTIESLNENQTISEDGSDFTNIIHDVNTSTTIAAEAANAGYNISLSNNYSTIDLLSYNDITSSTTSASNEHSKIDDSISKTDLIKDVNKLVISSPIEYPNLPCHTSCPLIQGKRYCWGPGRDQCQAAHKCQIRLCEGSNWCFRTKSNEYDIKSSTHHQFQTNMNYATSKEQCCHSECAAGCYGPRARDCNACLRLSNRGVCTDSCPASKRYNKSTFNGSDFTNIIHDVNTSTTITAEATNAGYNISLSNNYSTIDHLSYNDITSSTTSASNEHSNIDDSISKSDLVKDVNKLVISSPIEYPNLPCHTSCPLIQGKRYCWGPGRDQCQAAHKCQIRLCEGSNWCFRTKSNEYDIKSSTHHQFQTNMNYATSKEQCCHSECAAGCYGPRARDCNACLRLSNRGVCTDSCPASKRYNKSTFSWVENPDGLLTLGTICVKSCPRYVAYQGECIPCPNSICPKVCTLKEIESIKGVDYLHRKSLRAMENCTVFEGDIKLSMQSFIGAGSHAPWMTNLTFLSNVKIIGGISQNIQQTRTININLNYHLEFLGMKSLQKLGYASLLITGNPRLCYVDTIDWINLFNNEIIQINKSYNKNQFITINNLINNKLLHNNYFYEKKLLRHKKNLKKWRTFKDSMVFIGGNAHFEFCRGRGAVCNELCQPQTGCWGPGIQFCLRCKYWSVENSDGSRLCVENCEDIPGFYTPTLNDIDNNIGELFNNESVTMIHLQNISKSILMDETTKSTEFNDQQHSNSEKKVLSYNEISSYNFSSMKCKKCSDMCSLQKKTCYGPNDDQCVGSCRFVQACPFGTYQHVINLHHRGGSSVDRQLTTYFSMKEQDEDGSSLKNNLFNRSPWSQTDDNLFYNLPSKIRDEIAVWLINHTQPKLYGLAQICLPCNEQCHSNIILSRQSNLVGSSSVACYGPSPEQCVRCAYASYQGRCVSTCPTGTYPKQKLFRNFDTYLQQFQFYGYSPDNITSYECLPCHYECEIGCSGPTANECTRCRHVKIYHDSQMKSWLCNNTCPDFSPFQITDKITGEIICSTDINNLHILPYNKLQSYDNNQKSINNTLINNNKLNIIQNYQLINQLILSNQYLSTDNIGLMYALIALLIMLLLLINHRLTTNKLFNTLNWNDTSIEVNCVTSLDKKDKLINSVDEDKTPTYSDSLKPNMATLRIITESELIRGPLIGSGAFGTVYCGVWCPKFIRTKSDSTNGTCSTLTTATVTPTSCLSNVKKFDWDKHINEEVETTPEITNDNLFNLNIPVAIKVLSDSADPQTNKELLEEAKVMLYY
ncbi:Receptor tyrosine-protein kinase erbB-2 [Schistosoma japonicum]|nr:Receptor tyrosine-protein kinase erbB-2 [Schistosoma japonicum]